MAPQGRLVLEFLAVFFYFTILSYRKIYYVFFIYSVATAVSYMDILFYLYFIFCICLPLSIFLSSIPPSYPSFVASLTQIL